MGKGLHIFGGRRAYFFLLMLTSITVRLAAQGTAFLYQGRLNDTGAPANAAYDFCFTVYDAVTNGDQVSVPLTNSAVVVSNGLFNVTLDFGPGIFTGSSYWLDIGVRAAGFTNFTTLSPRQPVLPVPYAVFATSASNLLGTLTAAQVTGLGNAALANTNTMTVYAALNAQTVPATGITGTPSANTYYADTNALWFANTVGITDQDARNDLIIGVNEIKKRNCWTNLVAFGSLSYRFNPQSNIDFLGNPRAAVGGAFYKQYPAGAEFYGTNYFTQAIPQLTNFTICFSETLDIPAMMAQSAKGWQQNTNFYAMDLIDLMNTNDGSTMAWQKSYSAQDEDKIQLSTGTNFDQYYMLGQVFTPTNGSLYPYPSSPAMMANDKFSQVDILDLTRRYWAVSVKVISPSQARVTAYCDGKICGFWFTGYGQWTNSGSTNIMFQTPPTAVNLLHIGGGNTNWNRMIDPLSPTGGAGGVLFSGLGTNDFFHIVNGYEVYNTFAEGDGGNPNIIPAAYASELCLEYGHALVSIQGSSIMSDNAVMNTNMLAPLLQRMHPDWVVLQEASAGGGGIVQYNNLHYGYVGTGPASGIPFNQNSVLLAPVGKFTRRLVVNDSPRNSTGSALSTILAAYQTVYNPYITNGVEVCLVLNHDDPNDSVAGLQTLENTMLVCVTNFPNTMIVPEWKYVTSEYIVSQGGNAHPYYDTSTCAWKIYSGMIGAIFNGGWNASMPTTGTNLTITAGTWNYTNMNPYRVVLTIGGTITNLVHGINSMINVPATGIFTVPVQPFGDYISVGSSNAPTCYLDSTPQ